MFSVMFLLFLNYKIIYHHNVQNEQNLSYEHTEIFTLKFGSMVMIVMADPKVVKECFVTQGANFNDRDTESFTMQEAKKRFGDFGK